MDLEKLIDWRDRMESIAQRLPFESERQDVHSMLAELDRMLIAAQENEAYRAAIGEVIAAPGKKGAEISDEKKADEIPKDKKAGTGKTSSSDAAA